MIGNKSFVAHVHECVCERRSKAFKKRSYICTGGLLTRVNSRYIYMVFVMEGLDFSLKLRSGLMIN